MTEEEKPGPEVVAFVIRVEFDDGTHQDLRIPEGFFKSIVFETELVENEGPAEFMKFDVVKLKSVTLTWWGI